ERLSRLPARMAEDGLAAAAPARLRVRRARRGAAVRLRDAARARAVSRAPRKRLADRNPGGTALAGDQLAHPGGGAHGAAEAVEVHADDVARAAAGAVARKSQQLLARVGVRHELGDAGAEVAQRP